MSSSPAAATVRTLTIDKSHSEVAFEVRHLIAKVRGHFADFQGTICFDAVEPRNSSVEVTIQSASIGTNEPNRDTHLKSDDFFSAATYPTLTFVSTAVTAAGGNAYRVEGDLSIRGVTRRVVLDADYLGEAKDPWGKNKVAFEARTTINRSDFELTWNAALETGGFLVGDQVKVLLSIEAA
jgi:polyisoprenoid-binding protein YceI